MNSILHYMGLAYPYTLVINASSEAGSIIIRLDDNKNDKAISKELTFQQVSYGKVDLIAKEVESLKLKMLSE